MNLLEEIEKIKFEGYNEANAGARLAQDIILYGISKGSFNRNVTIKGGVVMRNLSKNSRRATQDIDLDFIRYSISNESIEKFINKLQLDEGLSIELTQPLIELKHQDYQGKRAHIVIKDQYENQLESKIDIGVHKDLDIKQDEYCFDICFQEDGASLLINSKEQIVVEKLKSFLRLGTRSTRYKDVFDICYLSNKIEKHNLHRCLERYIFEDASLPVNNMEELITRLELVFTSPFFRNAIIRSRKNWLDMSVDKVLEQDLKFVRGLHDKVVV